MDEVWAVFQDMYDDVDGTLFGVEVVLYASEQTAKQHADAHGGTVVRQPVLTKLRSY